MAINIVALGGSGAGKSLYLASLYRKLSTSLRIDDQDEERRLNLICSEVFDIRTGTVKTIGTSDFKKWRFRWQLRGKHSDYSVGSFTYLDYAGGKINSIKNASNQEGKTTKEEEKLKREIEKAHIILIFLDGIRIVDMMRRNREQLPSDSLQKLVDWQNNDIPNILDYIKRTRCPLQIVITKWDALVSERFDNLGNIISQLQKEIEGLKSLIDERRKLQSQPPRWIPISSLGMNIAQPIYEEIVEDNVEKRKFQTMRLRLIDGNPPTQIEPRYVDVVLSYAMIDTLKEKLKNYQQLNMFSKIAVDFALEFIFDMIPYKIGKIIQIIWKLIFPPEESNGVDQAPVSRENIKSREEALVYIIGEHLRKIQNFEREFNVDG
jgi:hypothetical protein